MDLIGGLWGYIIAGLLAVGGILAAMAKARASGKESAQAENNAQIARENAEALKRQSETMKDTNDAKTQVGALPVGDAERELREQWTRPGEHN